MLIGSRISEIPTPAELIKRLSAYSKIDAVMMPEKEWLRRYHYDKNWLQNGHFYKIDDSGGDHYYILFSNAGCIIKGFDHECELSPYNCCEQEPMPSCVKEHDFYKDAPLELVSLLDDPALEKDLVTFCTWRTADDTKWHFAPSDIPKKWNDGIETFIEYTGDIEWYCEDFKWYFSSEIDKQILQNIFEGSPITSSVATAMNSNNSPEIILETLKNIF